MGVTPGDGGWLGSGGGGAPEPPRGGGSTGGGEGPAGGGGPGAADAEESLRFARLLSALALAILALAGVLIVVPALLQGPPIVYLIGYGTAALFGPVGFSLLAAAWRIRNRAVHGTALPASQRRNLRILGAALVLVGLFLAFGDFGVSGTISRMLNLVWGISLALYGVRFVVRSFLADRE